jgi:2-dehydro-3-deoxy-L-rhamnonate dehydrogenase (NAD+)
MSIPSGQTAIITGGARGIGHGIAKRLAREGCRVILWDIDFNAFEAEAQEFTPILKQKVDVSDFASVEAAFAEALRVAGSIEMAQGSSH